MFEDVFLPCTFCKKLLYISKFYIPANQKMVIGAKQQKWWKSKIEKHK